MVMEDAVALGEEVAKGDDLNQALRNYSERRFERCKQLVDIVAHRKVGNKNAARTPMSRGAQRR